MGGLSCCDTMFKILLFVFNFIFFLTGICVIAVGSVTISQEPDYETLMGTSLYNIAILLIVIGCIITIVCFCGCFGAMQENKCLLYTYSAFLCVIFCMELAGGIAAFIYWDDLQSTATTNMKDNLKTVNCNSGDSDYEDWQNMQQKLTCCGANGYYDWFNATVPGNCHIYNLNPTGSSLLPYTCCPDCSTDDCCTLANYQKTYPPQQYPWGGEGCGEASADKVNDSAVLLGGIGVGLAVVEIVGIILACCLAKDIGKHH